MNNNNNSSSNENPLRQLYDEWSYKTPFITRYSLIWTIIIYLLSFFFSADSILGNTPFFTIYQVEVYRIIFAPLVGNSIITLLMICLFYPSMGTRIENSIGSAGFLSLLSIFSLIINLLFDLICLILSFVGMPEAMFWGCSGFWTILFGLIVVECMQMPDVPRRLMCIPVDIPSKYFPIVLYLFFSLLSGPELSYALGMIVGYLYTIGKLDFIKPSTQRLQHFETAGLLSSLSRSTGWIPVGSALGVSVYVGDSSHPSNSGGNSRDPEQGNDDGSSLSAGTVWRTGKQSSSSSSTSSSYSNTNPTAPTSQTMQNQPFPGSGRTLSNNSGSSSLWSSQSSSSDSKSSRAEMAARRLAALNRNDPSYQGDNSSINQYVAGVASAPINSSSGSALTTLLDMGFNRVDANNALQRANGNLDVAIQILSSK